MTYSLNRTTHYGGAVLLAVLTGCAGQMTPHQERLMEARQDCRQAHEQQMRAFPSETADYCAAWARAALGPDIMLK